MKRWNRFVIFIFVLVLLVNPAIRVQAYATSESEYDRYANCVTESIDIDGVVYNFYYCYQNGNRTIIITNNSNDCVDIVSYNEEASLVLLNDEACISIVDSSTVQPMYTDGWELVSSSSKRVEWAAGTNSAVVAAALAVYLPTLGAVGVIAAMGSAALGTLAASAIGGTLYTELQWCHTFLSDPQYRYYWTFTASTGDRYGPFYYAYVP